ncbi:hypothetical protein ACP70R_037795 [Stipagrostis hirtigluma subsp. patula]
MDGAAAALPEDVLFEVFSRVQNARDLLRCALACKTWLRLFADPAFLRRLWPPAPQQGQGNHRSRLLGFFFQATSFWRRKRLMKRRARQHSSAFAPTFLPAPGSPLGPGGGHALTSFVSDDDGTFNYARPLASRRGMLLVRLVPRTFERSITTGLLVGVCNPITGERHVAPPLECTCLGRYVEGYAIVMATDSDGLHGEQPQSSSPPSLSSRRFDFSQLFLTGVHQDDRRLHLHSYSGATCSWSAPTKCLNSDLFAMDGASAAVVHRGAAHWLYTHQRVGGLYVLRAETGTAARVSLNKLNISLDGSPSNLCVAGDRLSIASVRAKHVDVWTQLDGDDGGGDTATTVVWQRTRVIQIPPAAPDPDISWHLQPRLWFDLDMGAILGLYQGGGVFVVDIEREVVEKVLGHSPCCLYVNGYGSSVPYEVDLLEFFVSKLGGLCQLMTCLQVEKLVPSQKRFPTVL